MTQPKTSPTISVPRVSNRRRARARDWPRPPRRDPHTRLIAQLLQFAGPESSVIATSSRPWASATFIGARHTIVLKMVGTGHMERATKFAEMVPDAELSISGHIVADICVDESSYTRTGGEDTDCIIMRLSALTIEDW